MLEIKYLRGATFTLKCSVLYPLDKTNSKLAKCLYIFWAFLYVSSFVTVIIQCGVYLYKNPFDLVKEAMTVMNGVFYSSLFLNFIIFYKKSSELVHFVININKNFMDCTDNQMESISMEKASKFSDKISYYWTVSLAVTAVGPPLLSLVTGNRNMPIPAWFPYDSEKSPLFEISYIWQMFCLMNLGIIYGATDMIYPCITTLIRQQFKILASNYKNSLYYTLLRFGVPKNIVKNFAENFNSNCKSPDLVSLMNDFEDIFMLLQLEDFQKVNREYLKRNIRYHTMLLKCSNDVNNLLGTFLMVKVSAVIFNLTFIAFGILHTDNQGVRLGLLNYFLFATIEIFIYTYSGQILTQNANFLTTLYEGAWYLCDLKYQKIFLTVQMKTKEEIYTKAGNYFPMTASSFIAFMRAVFSYIAVLKEVTDRTA